MSFAKKFDSNRSKVEVAAVDDGSQDIVRRCFGYLPQLRFYFFYSQSTSVGQLYPRILSCKQPPKLLIHLLLVSHCRQQSVQKFDTLFSLCNTVGLNRNKPTQPSSIAFMNCPLLKDEWWPRSSISCARVESKEP